MCPFPPVQDVSDRPTSLLDLPDCVFIGGLLIFYMIGFAQEMLSLLRTCKSLYGRPALLEYAQRERQHEESLGMHLGGMKHTVPGVWERSQRLTSARDEFACVFSPADLWPQVDGVNMTAEAFESLHAVHLPACWPDGP